MMILLIDDENDDLDTIPESAGLPEESNEDREEGIFPVLHGLELPRAKRGCFS